MTKARDSQCYDQRKRNTYRVTSSTTINTKITTTDIYSVPIHKIPLSRQRILLVLPHSIFRHFSYHEKSFTGYSKKYLQFQEETGEESTRANLQLSQATCSRWLQIAQSKLPIKMPTLPRKFAKLLAKEHPV